MLRRSPCLRLAHANNKKDLLDLYGLSLVLRGGLSLLSEHSFYVDIDNVAFKSLDRVHELHSDQWANSSWPDVTVEYDTRIDALFHPTDDEGVEFIDTGEDVVSEVAQVEEQ